MVDVFIDMDSTMNDFATGYVNYYNKLYGTSHKLSRKDLIQYEISKCIPDLTDDEAFDSRERIFGTPGFWVDLPIYPNASQVIEWINSNFNTYILTAPWVNTYGICIPEKYEWVQKHLPFFPLNKVIFMHDKHLIHPDSVLIDDHAKNLGRWRGKTIKYVYPYNKNSLSHFEADSWNKVGRLMKGIKKDLEKHGRITNR